MLERPLPFFVRKTNLALFHSLKKKKDLYFADNLNFQVGHVLLRYTLTDFHDFGINGSTGDYNTIIVQTTVLTACQFQVYWGW